MKQTAMAGIDDYRSMLSNVADELSPEDAKSLACTLNTTTAARDRISCGRELVQEMERIKFVSKDNVWNLFTLLRTKNFNVAADIVDKYKMSTKDSISSECKQSPKRRRKDTHQEVRSDGKKDLFIRYLRFKYKELFLAVQPLPYVKDRMCCVDKVFIQGNIEYLPIHSRWDDIWHKMKSYHDIITKIQTESTRHIILGDPGYGKSTLILQFLYDWCEQVQESPLHDVGIVIFLRMRQLAGLTSIYNAIKELLLPTDSTLTTDDIKEILQSTESTMIFLDGYDEYPDKSNVKTDFNEMLKMKKLVHIHVIVTTRSADVRQTPDELKILSTQIRLAGFDETDQERYILKAVVGGNGEAARLIREQIKENPVLDDICQIPLFFTIFAHATFDKKVIIPKTESVTWVFRFILECFFEHTKNKYYRSLTDIKSNMAPIELCKIAYDGLSKENQQIVWNKKFLVKNVGENYYQTLLCTGILTEEDVIDVASRADMTDFFQYQTMSSFYHKLFCEWYAARYLVECINDMLRNDNAHPVSNNPSSSIEQGIVGVLSRLDRTDLQYLIRFASGLNTNAGGTIINYLMRQTGDTKLATLCMLEYGGKDETIKDAVEIACSQGISFKDNESKILQRACMRLIEVASSYNILISQIYLQWSFSEVVEGDILLRSGLRLQRISCLEKISINGDNEKFSEKDVIGLIKYGMQSHRFQKIWFYYCDLPETFTCDLIPASIKATNIKVLRPTHARRLEFTSGRWNEITEIEDIRELCTDEVAIDNLTSEAAQRSVITLLEKASSHDISIFGVGFVKSFRCVDGGTIVLHSGLSLPILPTLETMFIQTEYGREIDLNEANEIIGHLVQWKRLHLVDFRYCLLPSTLSGSFLPVLQSKEVKVFWSPYGYGYKTYLLNLESGRWMPKKESAPLFPKMPNVKDITNEDYYQEVRAFRTHWRDEEWQQKRLGF